MVAKTRSQTRGDQAPDSGTNLLSFDPLLSTASNSISQTGTSPDSAQSSSAQNGSVTAQGSSSSLLGNTPGSSNSTRNPTDRRILSELKRFSSLEAKLLEALQRGETAKLRPLLDGLTDRLEQLQILADTCSDDSLLDDIDDAALRYDDDKVNAQVALESVSPLCQPSNQTGLCAESAPANPGSLTLQADAQHTSAPHGDSTRASAGETLTQAAPGPADAPIGNSEASLMQHASSSTSQPQSSSSEAPLGTTSSFAMPFSRSFVPANVATANLVSAFPKIELEKFDGNPLQWGDWVRKYLFLIDDIEISLSQKMAYLQGLVCGRAKEAIQHYSCNGEMYDHAIAALKNKFGEPEVVVHHYLDKLAELKPLNSSRPDTYIEFASFLNGMVRNFIHLDYKEDLSSTSTLRTVISKLPYAEQMRWTQYLVDHKIERADLRTFNTWFQSKAQVHERMSRHSQSKPEAPRHQTSQIGIRAAQSEQRNDASTTLCILGGLDHPLYRCPKFKEMSVEERHSHVMKEQRCFNCLKTGHNVKQCSTNLRCLKRNCGGKHHTLLHGAPRAKVTKQTNLAQGQPPTALESEKSSFANVNPDADVMLQVLPVVLHNDHLSLETYAFLDHGSDFSILLEDAAAKLQIVQSQPSQLTLAGINQTTTMETRFVDLEISPHGQMERFPLKNVNVLRKANMPKIIHQPGAVVRQYPHLRNVKIPTLKDAKVTLLLGLDVIDLIWPEETIKGPKGTPIGCRCALGWTICGAHSRLPCPKKDPPGRHKSFICQTRRKSVCETCAANDDNLSEEVKSWYRAESLTQSTVISDDNAKALEILESTYRKDETGRIELGMLWKNENPLPNNRSVAEKHLNWILQKMSKDPALLEKYDQGIQDDLKKGFIHEISDPSAFSEGWLIPHLGVTNPNKPGKLRRVLNASSKYQGMSLNDNLLTGPDLIGDLLGILLRFRENPVAVTADVEAMFMQVAVAPQDRKYLRFLWRKSNREPIRLFEYLRHIFGKVDSPTCACYALLRAISEYIAKYPDLTGLAEQQFYMDDFLDSLNSVSSAIACSAHLEEALSKSHFNLTKWASNSEDFLRAKSPESLAKPIAQLLAPENYERVLGAHWNLHLDTILFRVPQRLHLDNPITQRKLLSFVASLFDPLGIAAPLVIRIKILLQDIWKDGQCWDQPIMPEKSDLVSSWVFDVQKLPPVAIPRMYFPRIVPETELHVFCDASLEATAVVAYLRFVAPGGKAEISFVLGKTRVAPIKQQTIPKLELQAAVYAVRMRKAIEGKTRLKITKVYHWTDSTSVLCWIRNPKDKHKMFVANRLSEILEDTKRAEWNHVPGKDNPADDGTRGLPVEYMTSSSRWITGPPFLRGEADWPKDFDPTPEHKSFVLRTKTLPSLKMNYEDVSTWSALVKKVKRVLRAVRIMQQKPSDEFRMNMEAKSLLLSQSVREMFPKEIEALQHMRPVSAKSRIVNYSPFLDDNGILRSASRIKNAPVSTSVATPLILDAKHPIVRLYLENQHQMMKHVGVEQMRNTLQQRYWIIGLRTALRAIVHRCFECRRKRALISQPQMADLPAYRFSAEPVAFRTVGVDMFGPFGVSEGRKTAKRYVCLFTCLVVRAVHLEVCEDLSTDSCLLAIRRFVAGRGKPKEIHSDNGTNFQGAARVLARNQKKILKELQSASASLEINWKFNPPNAPHFGGVWERLVGMSKRIFFTIAASQNLYPETFATLVCEVEAMLNDRPLTTVGSDVQDIESLTPAHFLIGRSNSNPVEFSQMLSCHTGTKKLYAQTKEVLNQFWIRLMKEFVTSLRDRPKWHRTIDPLNVGDLVWLLEANTPRGIWPLGRVIEAYPGNDGVIRSCKVKTQQGEMIKPVVKLARVLPETSGSASPKN